MKHLFILTFVILASASIAHAGNIQPPVSSPASPSERPSPVMPLPGDCGANQAWIGKHIDAIKRELDALENRVRIIHPRDMVTMDYSPSRLNVMLDDHDIVNGLKCG